MKDCIERRDIGAFCTTTQLPKLALSIRQPWAWAILHAGKDVENRDWLTRFRGPVCIHAAKGCTKDEYEDANSMIERCSDMFSPPLEKLERGGIIGVANITDCVTRSRSPWFFGNYGFVLKDPEPVPFIPVRGALGFFDWRKRLWL